MIYLLLHKSLNIVQYISFRATGAAITALIISFLIGPIIIRTLNFHHFGEKIRKNGPDSHLRKEGTPSMGGIIILLSIILPTILWADLSNNFIVTILISITIMGIIGFIDDYLKIKKSYAKGLIARYKLIGQIFLGILVSYLILNENSPISYNIINSNNIIDNISSSSISIPFIANGFLDIKYLYLPLVILIITATSNAVNLTDGLDGLAIVPVMIVAMTFAFIAYVSGNIVFSEYLLINYIPGTGELSVLCGALIGSALGFLWFNAPPAKVFMGDTGSLALGATLGSIALMVKHEIVLAIAGGLFVLETLSVVIQVISFKLTGKRVFRMAPLHHHYEKKGWSEPTIVIRFWIITFVLALLSLATLKIR